METARKPMRRKTESDGALNAIPFQSKSLLLIGAVGVPFLRAVTWCKNGQIAKERKLLNGATDV